MAKVALAGVSKFVEGIAAERRNFAGSVLCTSAACSSYRHVDNL